MKQAPAPFSRRMTIGLLVTGGVSLLAAFLATVFWGDSPDVRSNEATSYSTSALGHMAFFELLERTGHRVIRSRFQSATRAEDGLLVILEPDELDRLDEMLSADVYALVVLPKRMVDRDHERNAAWAGSVAMRDIASVQAVADRVGVGTEVRRAGSSIGRDWQFYGIDSFEPSVSQLQLLGDGPTPWIECDAGILLGQIDSQTWVLSDPDVLANHGLGHGSNAALIASICTELADGGPIVVDEIAHGLEFVPSIVSELRRFPLVLVLIHSFALLGVLLWAGARRFGPPLPDRLGIAAGKAVLIDNTTQLLLHGGHGAALVERYWVQAQRRVSEAYHVPLDLDAEARRQRLRRIGGDRVDFDAVEQGVADAKRSHPDDSSRLVAVAREIREWREETLNGTR